MTIAFVMSGAANYGSLQVGSLQVLLERGIRPDLLIGTSAGAMNAAYLAMDPTLGGLKRLADHWGTAARDILSRSDTLSMVWRLITKRDGLVSSEPLRRYIERWLPPGVNRYGDLKLPAYAVSVRLDTGKVRCFGDDPNDRLLDGLMASTAIPGFYPPWKVAGVDYIDGGVVAYLPIECAVERGATDVYALNVTSGEKSGAVRGTLAIMGRAVDLLIQRQGAREVQVHRRRPGITVHALDLTLHHDVAFWDFKHADMMVARGRELTEAYLEGQPASMPRRRRWGGWLSNRRRAASNKGFSLRTTPTKM